MFRRLFGVTDKMAKLAGNAKPKSGKWNLSGGGGLKVFEEFH